MHLREREWLPCMCHGARRGARSAASCALACAQLHLVRRPGILLAPHIRPSLSLSPTARYLFIYPSLTHPSIVSLFPPCAPHPAIHASP